MGFPDATTPLASAKDVVAEGPGAFGRRQRRSSLTYSMRVCSFLAPWLAPKTPPHVRRRAP